MTRSAKTGRQRNPFSGQRQRSIRSTATQVHRPVTAYRRGAPDVTCEVCGRPLDAGQVRRCARCGAVICWNCISPESKLCRSCREEGSEDAKP